MGRNPLGKDKTTGRFLGYATEEEREVARLARNKRHNQNQYRKLKADSSKWEQKLQWVREWRIKNRESLAVKAKEVYAKRKVLIREKKFGLEEGQWLKILEAQAYKCAICKTSVDESTGCTDHNHKTGFFRGILCSNCNKALGLFKEDPDILEIATLYLKEHS